MYPLRMVFPQGSPAWWKLAWYIVSSAQDRKLSLVVPPLSRTLNDPPTTMYASSCEERCRCFTLELVADNSFRRLVGMQGYNNGRRWGGRLRTSHTNCTPCAPLSHLTTLHHDRRVRYYSSSRCGSKVQACYSVREHSDDSSV